MKKLIYVEENFISPDECQRFIDLSLSNKGKEMPYGDETRGGDTYLTLLNGKIMELHTMVEMLTLLLPL